MDQVLSAYVLDTLDHHVPNSFYTHLDCLRGENKMSLKHSMKLNEAPFNEILEGTKTIEIRLNDEKRQTLSKL